MGSICCAIRNGELERDRKLFAKRIMPLGKDFDTRPNGKQFSRKNSDFSSAEAIYTGEKFDGKQHGKGVQIFPDGTRFEGMWEHGYAKGFGTCVYSNGDVYEGMWDNSKHHGHGKLTKASGHSYVGDWFENE